MELKNTSRKKFFFVYKKFVNCLFTNKKQKITKDPLDP